MVKKLSSLTVCFSKKIAALEQALLGTKEVEGVQELADYYKDHVFAAMQELRAVADEMEINTSSKYWPYPSYGQLLFGVYD